MIQKGRMQVVFFAVLSLKKVDRLPSKDRNEILKILKRKFRSGMVGRAISVGWKW